MWKYLALSLLMICFNPRVSLAENIVLLKDDFNTENNGEGKLNYSNFVNWIVTNGSVDLIGEGLYDIYPKNGLYIDLDGSTNQGGTLETRTSFHLEPGTYELQFDIANNNNSTQYENTVTVSLGALYSENFILSERPPYQTILRTITVTEATIERLVFEQAGGDNDGIIIDNVRLIYLSE